MFKRSLHFVSVFTNLHVGGVTRRKRPRLYLVLLCFNFWWEIFKKVSVGVFELIIM